MMSKSMSKYWWISTWRSPMMARQGAAGYRFRMFSFSRLTASPVICRSCKHPHLQDFVLVECRALAYHLGFDPFDGFKDILQAL
jgi:hypothetical protein